jgi:hypothetical protein
MGYLGGNRQLERVGDAFFVQIVPDRGRIWDCSHLGDHRYQTSGPRRNHWLTSIWRIPKYQAEASQALSVAATALIFKLRRAPIWLTFSCFRRGVG